jgi:hypothetical protein
MDLRTENGMNHARFRGLIPVILVGLLVSGCGIKTYPKPITREQIPQIQDLKTVVRLNTVEVTWSVPDQIKDSLKESGYSFVVLKAELSWANRNCPDCPASSQQEAVTIDPSQPAPAVREGNVFIWKDTAVSTQCAYRYQVDIRDRNRLSISSSNSVMAKVLAPPPTLKSLDVIPEQRGLLVQWKAGTSKPPQGSSSPGEVQYIVERHGPDGTWEKLSVQPVKGYSFLDSTLAAAQNYDYQVTPVYVFEDTPILGEPSVFRQAKAPDAVPPPPPGKVWVIPVKGALEVHWLKSDGKVEGYHVYRREGREIIRLTAAPVQNPPYLDRSVNKNVIYSYAVSAVGGQAKKREGLLSSWAEIRSLMLDQ